MAPAKPALELGFSDRLLDGGGGATGPTRRIAEQARRELAEYLAGRRAFFSVPVDLTGVWMASGVSGKDQAPPLGASTT